MAETEKYINLGILAHVDAGKTSLSELFLYKTGAIRSKGSVDKGNSVNDSLMLEKERGISIKTSSSSFVYEDCNFNLIDTPGHIDFSAEVERALAAMDACILLVSAAEGVQAHTLNIWNAINKLNLPCLIFVNKCDRAGVDSIDLLSELKNELGSKLLNIQNVTNEGGDQLSVADINFNDESISEQIIETDETLFEKFLNGSSIDETELKLSLKNSIANNVLIPVLWGSVKLDIGIEILLEFIYNFLPKAEINVNAELSGIVYKLGYDKLLGKVASLRLFSGSIKNRDSILINGEIEEKVSVIKKLQGDKFEDKGELLSGDSAAICGLKSVKAGDYIGDRKVESSLVEFSKALLLQKIEAENASLLPRLVEAMNILNNEDPKLNFQYDKFNSELRIDVMGGIQTEILQSVLQERFGLNVSFGDPQIVYKETPASTFEVEEVYTMPKPCWAIVKFKIESLNSGSGFQYSSIVSKNKIADTYQKEIERNISKALSQGIHGWEVTDLKITLIDGEHHNIHSRAGDFGLATCMAIIKGLKEFGSQILEPILEFTIKSEDIYLGKIASDLTLRRAEFANPQMENNKFKLSGRIPLSESLDYSLKLNSITGGKAKLSLSFDSYQAYNPEIIPQIPYKGISPLDRSKYILQHRNGINNQ